MEGGRTSSAPAHYEIFSLNQSLDSLARDERTNERTNGRTGPPLSRRKEGEGVEGRIEGRGTREGLGPGVYPGGRGREDTRVKRNGGSLNP